MAGATAIALDLRRLFVYMTVAGVYIAPATHYWFNYLDAMPFTRGLGKWARSLTDSSMTAQSTEEDNLSAASSQGHGLLPDHVREKTNTFLSSLRHSSVTFDPVNDCWEVSILASNGYLWCRIILSHSAVKVMPLEGNSEALDSFTRQLEQVLSEPVQEEEEEEEEEGVSLLTTWLQSISSDQDDPFGFYSPSTSSLVYKKAIEVLVTAVDVSMREKLSAVQVLLEATESNSPAVLDEVVGNGLVEAVLTLFTSTTTSTSTSISTSTTTSTSTSNVLWDDPYLVKPYGLQILHALLNGGGGHGALGYYLGQEVLAGGGRLTILQDKCDYSQQPFSSYRNDFQLLPQQLQDTPPPPPPDTSSVVRVLSWSDVKTASREKLVSLGLGQIDYLVDNWSKKVEDAQTVLELARQLQVSQLVFISSAGMYQEGNYHPAGHSQGQGHYSMPLLREEDVVHEENASRKVEQEVIASGLPYTILRLQYLYGELSNKRYLDYFWRFLEQGEDIVWPGSGDQLVALTHQRDVARCILQVLGHAGAVKEIFNCGTDRYVSYATLASMAKEAWKHCGKSTKMGQAGSNGSGSSSGKVDDFPFRSTTFITSPHKVMARVGWRAHEDLWDGLLKEASSYPSSQ
eukprot:gene7711-8518_t